MPSLNISGHYWQSISANTRLHLRILTLPTITLSIPCPTLRLSCLELICLVFVRAISRNIVIVALLGLMIGGWAGCSSSGSGRAVCLEILVVSAIPLIGALPVAWFLGARACYSTHLTQVHRGGDAS
ncbi:hypothetical protein QBC47DRAFT_388086 [Echria macrotheca]|uniref:Uncharacterized protein n=1 Tax=Echria macrotheca TaxID=438768 RepID=A0AAJ0B9K5_9PEZI|nr:hypothetical protein QBC47DRAFT_388086 [Echria macrotheca]